MQKMQRKRIKKKKLIAREYTIWAKKIDQYILF